MVLECVLLHTYLRQIAAGSAAGSSKVLDEYRDNIFQEGSTSRPVCRTASGLDMGAMRCLVEEKYQEL